ADRFRRNAPRGRPPRSVGSASHRGRTADDPPTRQPRAAGRRAAPDAEPHAGDRLLDPQQLAASAPGDRVAARLLLHGSRARALPRQCLHAARLPRSRLPPHPVDDGPGRAARPPGNRAHVRQEAPRPGARHRADRFGQVDDACLADQRDQRDARRAHPHHRGPDRVPAQAQALRGQPARSRRRCPELRSRAQSGAAPGPRRDPRRRDARHGDDRHGADRRRDRPPGLRDAAHAGRATDDRPHHRRLPRQPAGAGPHAAVGRPAGRGDPDADPHRRRAGPLRGVGDPHPDARRAQPDPRAQDAPDLLADPDGRRARHADHGHVAGHAGARSEDLGGHRRSTLEQSVRAAPAAPDGRRGPRTAVGRGL
ncbi:MAG: Twitching motility protein PilT, partial [uncultured Solirubrobacteraceae bacterium]